MSFDDKKMTLVLGASPNPGRYSHRATVLLRQNGHPVWALGRREGRIFDVEISTQWQDLPAAPEAFHTVTLYLDPANQADLLPKLLALRPKRVIFNPGAENAALVKDILAAGIAVENACTLVLLNTGQY